VSKNADPGSATNASCPSAYMYGAQPLSGDLSSTVPHGNNDWRGDSVTGSYLQSLANENQGSKALSSALNSGSTTSLSFGQQNAPTSSHDLQAPQNTKIPMLMPWMPNNPTTVLGRPEKSFTVPSQTSVHLTHHSTIVELAKLPHASWRGSTSLLEAQQPKITPDQAYKAIQVVIDYCKRKPQGYLEIDEGVLLGTLARRLEHHCG
jgi:hypothetical protein